MSALQKYVDEVVKDFTISKEKLNECVDYFVEQTREGLRANDVKSLPMIPTFVTDVPNGKEKGTFLAVDLGGTNFRVCSVNLLGNSDFTITQEKWAVPRTIMRGSSADFYKFMADHIGKFLTKHHSDKLEGPKIKMGFTFSFPVVQTSLNRGKLLRWTKGFNIPDAVGTDICECLQKELDKQNLPVHVAALVNDTVGTLMARSYGKSGNAHTLIGCIFGTGTNGAYREKISNIPKFDAAAHPEITSDMMVINTEWGSFDNALKHIPANRFDVDLNERTPNPGFHMFEKRVSGMFLGELLRLVILEMYKKNLLSAIKSVPEDAKLFQDWSADSAITAAIDGDSTSNYATTGYMLRDAFGLLATPEEREAIHRVARAIGDRSAALAAVPIAGLILHTKAFERVDTIDIGGDGSVVEFYPEFEKRVRDALRKTALGSKEANISFGISKDGSGVGAALCALVAEDPEDA